jgi:hypothetical protein
MITCSPGRDLSDDGWAEFQPADIATWKEACSCVASKTYQHEQWEVNISIDWRPIVRRLQHNHNVSKTAFSRTDRAGDIKIWQQYRHGNVRVPCKVIAKTIRKKSSNYFHPGLYVQSFAYDVFLALNLAMPGSCDFYGSTVTSNFKRTPWELALSSHWFEVSYLGGRENKWPAPTQLPLAAVRDWLLHVRRDLAQVPNNQMEKVLFALWHICTEEVSPNTVIWLFNALETLFDTRPGENLRALQHRISALLSASTDQEKVLKKNLRGLYDLRSAFVHGGLEVLHPTHNELLDRRVDEKYWRVAGACEFGFLVLLRSLQEIISRKWHTVRFREEIVGEEVPMDFRKSLQA